MYRRDNASASNGGRMQWGSFGFFAGILVGILVGWFFAGFIGAFVRVAIVAAALIPIVLLFIAWRKIVAPFLRPPVERQRAEALGAIETRAVVHAPVGEPRTR